MVTKKEQELKKRDAIMTCTQIINMPKYKVRGHETISKTSDIESWAPFPKGTTDILVIYLGK